MKSNFKNAILGLILALCCIFTICTSSFMGAKVNAIEEETQEEQEEGKTYTYEDEYGSATITLYEDGTFKCVAYYKETQETLEGYGEYQVVDEFVVLVANGGEIIIKPNYDTMTFEPVMEEENPPIEEDPGEEQPGDAEDKIGFFERNLETIVATVIGVLGSIAAFFLMVIKAGKSVKDTLNAFKGKEISAEEAMSKINKQVTNLKEAKDKVFEELNSGKDKMLEISKNLEEQFESMKTFSEEILNKYSNEINKMAEDFKKISDSIILMSNNNEELVKKGVAEEINKKLNGGE